MGRPRKNAIPASAGSQKKVLSLDGLVDIITDQDVLWDILLKRLNKISRVYGFSRVETPFLEDYSLYHNVYAGHPEYLDRLITVDAAGKNSAIRPSLLPSVLRGYVQGKIYDSAPLCKWAYSGPVVQRAKNSKALSEDYQFGYEVLGSFNHLTEAQVIGAVWVLIQSLGLKDAVLEINNIGKPECQVAYQETLQDFLRDKKYDLCDSCNDHLSGRVLNVFRCDNLGCQTVLAEAPTILDFLDQESHKHFTNILEALDELAIPYQLNPLFSGPEGFGKTNVIIKYKLKDEVMVIGEGGYHDGLMQAACGKNFCCFGFTGSLTNIRTILEAGKVAVAREQRSDVFLVPLGELASKKSLRLFRDLTGEKVSVYDHFGNSGVKNQLKQAESFKAPIALIMGQKEAMDELVILRDVKSGMQEVISYDKIVEEVKKRLGK